MSLDAHEDKRASATSETDPERGVGRIITSTTVSKPDVDVKTENLIRVNGHRPR